MAHSQSCRVPPGVAFSLMKKAHLYVAISAILYGYITVGGRLLADRGFSLYEVSFFPMCTAALILGLSRPLQTRRLFGQGALRFFVVYGLIGALLQITQYGGIVLGVPVAVVAMLLYTQPIWTTLMGRLWLGEPITRVKLAALALALAGIVILLDPIGLGGSYPIAGLLSALAGGLVLGAWVIWTKRSAVAGALPPLVKVYGYALFTVIWLVVLLPLSRLLLANPDLTRLSLGPALAHWPLLLLMATLALILPYTLIFRGIHELDATSAGTLLMLEPISAAILATFIFRERLTPNVLLGGALILLGNFIMVRYGAPVDQKLATPVGSGD